MFQLLLLCNTASHSSLLSQGFPVKSLLTPWASLTHSPWVVLGSIAACSPVLFTPPKGPTRVCTIHPPLVSLDSTTMVLGCSSALVLFIPYSLSSVLGVLFTQVLRTGIPNPTSWVLRMGSRLLGIPHSPSSCIPGIQYCFPGEQPKRGCFVVVVGCPLLTPLRVQYP